MSLPLLEVLPVLGIDDRLVELLASLRPYAEVRIPDRALPAPAARIAASPSAVGALARRSEEAVPLGVWVTDERTAAQASSVLDAATVVITPVPAVAARFGDRGLLLPNPSVPTDLLLQVAPIVRRRWREALGLPSELVVSCGLGDGPSLSETVTVTALALAAAAAVSSAWVLPALSLGAPTVVDAATAAQFGLEDGKEVLVAAPSGAVARARQLASDHELAARLSRAGRRAVERRFDRRQVTTSLVHRLELDREQPSALALVQARLRELHTPEFSSHFLAATAAVAGLSGWGTDR
jgi:hypothetical protein